MSGLAYHGVDAGTHRQRVNDLAAAGLRPVAINISGDPGDPRYAAVWLERPGPDWKVVQDLPSGEYQARFDELTGQGYAPTILTATGPAGSERYAAVFERGVQPPWFARHRLRWDPATDPDTLTHENSRAFAEGYIPRCLTVYGDPSDRRFAGVWVKNTDAVLWSWWFVNGPQAYQRFMDALARGGMRPAVLSVASDGFILSVFRGDRVGDWHERQDLTAAEYQAESDRSAAEGLRPIVVAAGGVGDRARYAAVFAADDLPMSRSWSVSGVGFPGADALDEAVRTFMVRHGIRAGSVAIGRDAVVVGARGYTWAEPGYPVTQPATRFRIASLSKMFTAATLSRLVQAGRLSWDTAAFGFVGVDSALPAGAPAALGMDEITVEQLVLRSSHLPRDFDREQREIAGRLGIDPAPIPRRLLLRYLYGLPLVGAIPPGGLYSNSAFFVLTSVVERASGLPFVAALGRHLLHELDIHDVEVAATALDARQPDEVATYDDAVLHDSQLDLAPNVLAPGAYGGDFVLENGEGAGGLMTSAPSIVRLIARYPVWNADKLHLTGRELATRYGILSGTSSGATSRPDGLDFAFLFNRRVTDAELDEILLAIHTVLNVHGRAL
jgi:CubicO group peptidase (beta-lactamase class C family)